MKVVNAMKAVREFLYGSANVAVLNIVLSDKGTVGILIGKSGSQKPIYKRSSRPCLSSYIVQMP